MNPNVPELPIEKEFLLRIPKEAITINNGKLFFNENYMGQCCGAWVSMFFMALDALSRTYISSYAVNQSGNTIPLMEFDPKERKKLIPKSYAEVNVDPRMHFKMRNEETGRTSSVPRFSVYLETCADAPGITTNDVLMWVLVHDKAFILEEFMLQYINTLKTRVSDESVDPKDITTPNKVRKNRKAVQTNDGGDIYRLLSNFKMYCDGCRFLSAATSVVSHETTITMDSAIAPSNAFKPARVLPRLSCLNKSEGEYVGFYRRYALLKPFIQHFGYDFIDNNAKFNALCLPYVVPMEAYRGLVYYIVTKEFPEKHIEIEDIPETIQFNYVYETDIDSYYYVHCYFLMWKQLLDEKMQMYRHLTMAINSIPFISLSDSENAILADRSRQLRDDMLRNFLTRVKTDLRPFENAAMLGNCSSGEFDVWNAPPSKNIFTQTNFVTLAYSTNDAGEQLDLDETLILFNHYMLTYDLDTHFGPRQCMRWNSQMFFDTAAGSAIGKDIGMALMCGDPSIGKGHNMKQIARMYPPGHMWTPTNISISFFNNHANYRGRVIFFDEIKRNLMDSKVDTQILNHLKNIGSNGYTGSNQQNMTNGIKESVAFPFLSGVPQITANFSEEFVFKSDDAFFSRVLSQNIGNRPQQDYGRKSNNITNIRIMQSIYHIYARFRELQFMNFFNPDKAMNSTVRSILTRFFSFVKENPHYSVYNRTMDQVEMRYTVLVTRFAVIKVMCTAWGYNKFHHLNLAEPSIDIYRAIHDQIQPSAKIMLFVLSLNVDTFFPNDSFLIEKEMQKAFKMYLEGSKLILKDIIYTVNTPGAVKMVVDPFYVALNITFETLFDRVKHNNKIGRIAFTNGMHALEKKEKFTASVSDFNCDCVIPKTRTCDGEPLLPSSGMLRRDVSPYIFRRAQDERILEVFIAKEYLHRLLNEKVENYFETFILPNIIPVDFTGSPIMTYGGLHYNNNYYIEQLNYTSYIAKARDESNGNKSLRTSEDGCQYEAMHDPLSIDTLVQANEEFARAHPGVTLPQIKATKEYALAHPGETMMPMLGARYPRDAIVDDFEIACREYTSAELDFLVFRTVNFRHAVNINLDKMVNLSMNFERVTMSYKKQLEEINKVDRDAFKDAITHYRALKTEIDENCLLYFHAEQIIRKMMATPKDAGHWADFCSMWSTYENLTGDIHKFDYADTERALRDVQTALTEIKTRVSKPGLYAQLFAVFPYESMHNTNNCPNKFMKDNMLYNMVVCFNERVFCKYNDNIEFTEELSTTLEGSVLPPAVDNFYSDLETFI